MKWALAIMMLAVSAWGQDEIDTSILRGCRYRYVVDGCASKTRMINAANHNQAITYSGNRVSFFGNNGIAVPGGVAGVFGAMPSFSSDNLFISFICRISANGANDPLFIAAGDHSWALYKNFSGTTPGWSFYSTSGECKTSAGSLTSQQKEQIEHIFIYNKKSTTPILWINGRRVSWNLSSATISWTSTPSTIFLAWLQPPSPGEYCDFQFGIRTDTPTDAEIKAIYLSHIWRNRK